MTRSTNKIYGRIKKYDKIDETREDQRKKDDMKREIKLDKEEVEEWARKVIKDNQVVFDRLADL